MRTGTPSRRRIDGHRSRHRKRLGLEALECRRLLATLVVSSTADVVDLNPGDGICEISSGGPCTLRAAIQEANALANTGRPDQITLPAGTYTLTLSGIDEQQSVTGDLDIVEDLIIQGTGATDTIIDGNGIDRVLDIIRGAVVIDSVTIRGGLIEQDDDPVEGSGGGIRNEDDLTITDSVITGNVASFGAGLANYNATLRVNRSVISGNGDSTTIRGGAIANYANYDPALLEVTESTISGNRADSGGGVSNRSYDAVATANIQRSTISGNQAQDGGGIANRSTGYYGDDSVANLTITGSTISGNTANVSGAGIRSQAELASRASLELSASTVTANVATAGDGGGILTVTTVDATTPTTINSVITGGNTAGGVGADLRSETAIAAFSLIQDPDGHSLVNGVNQNIVGQDPLLLPLSDNGGPTLTHALANGSPAIDQGVNPESMTNDQRGSAFARTIDLSEVANADDGTDMGAVEVGQVGATTDFGDAPDMVVVGGEVRQYPTQLSSNGARHRTVAGGPFLGSLSPDAEPDGQSTPTATGDDLVGIDDEEAFGGSALVFTPGQSLAGFFIAHNGGTSDARLSVWMDLNLDGDWDDSGEQILSDVIVPAGPASTSLSDITIPSSAPSGTTFIRLRISTQTGLSPRGEAIDGEVEDFAATIGTPPPQLADLSLTQSVSDPNPVIGQNVSLTVTLHNDGPDTATNVEVTQVLPFELSFDTSEVTQGSYDDLDGIWSVGSLAPGESAFLTITATVESSDTITVTAEVTDSDQRDPDSTPGNGISGEDDQFVIALGTCLASGPLHVGMNQLTFSCATPGSFSAFVFGSQRGTHTFERYGVTVDIGDAKEFSISIADAGGVAVALIPLTAEQLNQTMLFQAFEMLPGDSKSNTLNAQSGAQMLRAASTGSGGLTLQPQVLPAILDAAVSHWVAAGATPTDVQRMYAAHVSISELPGDTIGRAVGGSVILDTDAAGHGWFVDGTPWDSSEYPALNVTAAGTDSPAAGRIDLITTLVHELGHVIGLPDVDQRNHVMHGVLDIGVRRLPTSNTNPRDQLDVNDDGQVTALDALMIINRLKHVSQDTRESTPIWIGAGNVDAVFLDTTSDFRVSSLDALRVINHLGRERNPIAAERVQAVISPFSSDTEDDDFGVDHAVLDVLVQELAGSTSRF